jgi:DNA repair protein RadC
MNTYQPLRSIKSWAEEDRPREKLMLKGTAALTDAELVAILINSGTAELSAVDVARKVLEGVGNNLHELAKRSVKDLSKFRGIGEARAISIVAALELGRRRREQAPVERHPAELREAGEPIGGRNGGTLEATRYLETV